VETASVWEECCGAAEGFSHPAVVWSSSGFGHTAVHGAVQSDRSSAQFTDFGFTTAPRLQSFPGALDALSVSLPGSNLFHNRILLLTDQYGFFKG